MPQIQPIPPSMEQPPNAPDDLEKLAALVARSANFSKALQKAQRQLTDAQAKIDYLERIIVSDGAKIVALKEEVRNALKEEPDE